MAESCQPPLCNHYFTFTRLIPSGRQAGEHDPETLKKLLTPCPAAMLTMHHVSTLVNKVGNDTPECVKKIDSDRRTGPS